MGRYRRAMTRLVLINGAPGSGKSMIAHALAQDRSMTLALDIDRIKQITTLLGSGLNLAGVQQVLALEAETDQLRTEIERLRREGQ